MGTIAKNLAKIQKTLSDKVTLVAVSKTKPVSDLMQAYEAGQRIFGENKIQEMTEKWEEMPKDVEWHMIGHVQTNKVKYMAPYVHTIHAVDSLKLLKEINKRAAKYDRVINCLLQIKIAEEDTKFGLDINSARSILESEQLQKMPYLQITGLMGMATFTDDTAQIKREFEHLHQFHQKLLANHPMMKTLSIGMSGDYTIAMEHGSTMVRLGSSIFGARN